MVNLREIRTEWKGPQAQLMYSVMYFEAPSVAVAAQRTALKGFWDAVKAQLSNQYTFTIEPTGRIIDDASGTLVGSWSETTPLNGAGSIATQPVPDATQMLFRWGTGEVVNGRFLKGRTFVPGLSRDALVNGNLNGTAVTAMTGAANSFAAAGTGFVVWQRPRPSSEAHPIYRPGQSRPVASGSCWNELAVQRGRRG